MHSRGIFRAEVLSHGIGKSASKGTPQIIIKFKTSEGNITAYLALTDRSAVWTAKAVRNCGYNGDDFSVLNDEPELLTGNMVELVIEHEEWNGKTNAKVAWINVIGGGGNTPVDGDAQAAAQAKKFNAILKKADKVAVVRKDDTESSVPNENAPMF